MPSKGITSIKFLQLKEVLFISYLCIVYCLTSFKTTELQAIENQMVLLSCDAFTSAKKIPATVTLIKWIHQLFHMPLYTLDLRVLNQSLSKNTSFIHYGKHYPSPETEGRLYLDLNLDPIGLRIDPVFPEDAGNYTCQIEFKTSRSVSSTVALNVITPPKEVIIRDSTGKKCEGVVGPFRVGQTVSFTCEGKGGYPKPTVMWTSDARMYQRVTAKNSVLSIQHLQREDQWSYYTCSARNNNLTAAKSVTVIIELLLPPLVLTITSKSRQPLSAEQEVEITCQSWGSYPKAHIVWIKDGENLEAEEKITHNGNLTTSFIKFNVQASDDGKLVECIAVNPELSNEVLIRTLPLKVNYKPEVKIVILTNQSQLIEGNDMILMCTLKSNPNISTITWTFDNQELSNSSEISVNQNELHVKKLKKSNSGLYVCKANNSEGCGSESVKICIKYLSARKEKYFIPPQYKKKIK